MVTDFEHKQVVFKGHTDENHSREAQEDPADRYSSVQGRGWVAQDSAARVGDRQQTGRSFGWLTCGCMDGDSLKLSLISLISLSLSLSHLISLSLSLISSHLVSLISPHNVCQIHQNQIHHFVNNKQNLQHARTHRPGRCLPNTPRLPACLPACLSVCLETWWLGSAQNVKPTFPQVWWLSLRVRATPTHPRSRPSYSFCLEKTSPTTFHPLPFYPPTPLTPSLLSPICYSVLQSGFLILEAGYVSRFGLTNIIFKNVYDTMLSTLAFFILGWAFSFGGDDDGSAGYIAGHNGAMAGRCTFLTYTVYSLILCGFSYPILVHWTWSSTAWLAEGNGDGNGFRDFAGSGVVHMPHSTAFIGTGTMIIFFGFLFFNGGTAIGLAHNIGDSVNAVPLAITNTSILAGCVSSCASAGWVEPWAACIIGIGGGLTYYGASGLLERFRIDDALEASAVHAGAGAWGLIAEAIFHQELGIAYAGDANSFRHLGWQILGIVVIVLWIGLGVVVSLVPLWWYGLLRISARAEKLGALHTARHDRSALNNTQQKAHLVNVSCFSGIDLFQHHEISWDLQTQMVMDDAERNLPSRIVKNMYSDAHPSRDPSQAGDTGSAVQSLTMPTSLSRVQSLRRRERDFRTGLHDRDGPPPPSPLHHTILVNNDDANRRTLPRDSMTSVVVATEAIEPPPEAQRESVGNEFDFFDSERITSALTSANPKPLSSVDSIYSGKGSVISESCL
ncbi:uncharacterized protein MONBRDRAFT_27159 [Monosiga brevicollis MX1]|uniref:Ammonium transporter AmtB-like domain-containing protein n=1 Tax=Monosiga brevicollis TaxID=81824 RepID=A9V4H3_MONBE|nr:uncharacterized protein MONBRDRAFT_27159 [Monosiga brevicollis MX1]EDQ87615.1 predicted protein [Monosiga brevicollis MX1]|eukprot:XP_001747535.1 hypothetical protein [Monosiga brevicollis MX1]